MLPVSVTRTPGLTLYAFPDKKHGYSLADWLTHRVKLDESASPDAGIYTAELDESKGLLWRFFEGASQPTDWKQSKGFFPLPEAATGSGARLVTVTVLLDGAPVVGAKVRLTKGAESYLGESNGSGVVTFSVNDGTWLVSITSSSTFFAGASLVVDGNETVSYSLTAGASITPSEPGFVTGYWLCLSPSGVPEAGVTVSIQVSALPANSVGLALDDTIRTATSAGDGVAQFENLIPGVRYGIWRGDGEKFYVTIPTNATSPLELSSIIGNP